jgi:hypothetical protein
MDLYDFPVSVRQQGKCGTAIAIYLNGLIGITTTSKETETNEK